MQREAILLLDDTMFFRGISFAYPAYTLEKLEENIKKQNFHGVGELIFTTSMSGYVEYMTDPSYTGQIICSTYPLVGNYGVEDEWSESSNTVHSNYISLSALVVHELYRGPVINNRKTLEEWMLEQSILGLEKVDTRGLTKYIRDKGAKNAAIVSLDPSNANEIQRAAQLLSQLPPMEGRNLVSSLATQWQEYNPHGEEICTVIVYNCGTKNNIIHLLREKNCKVIVAPNNASSEEILARNPDMVLVSNGPGDPAVLNEQVNVICNLHEKTVLCGICLGNQLLGLSLGARTYKMVFGHHGVNHPVQDMLSSKLYITSQNHGFALDEKSLPKGSDIWFRNINDNSVEGFFNQQKKVYSVQFHPEACPGPTDANWIFDFFIQKAILLKTQKHKNEI